LLKTRELLLRSKGYEVVSAFGFTEALKCCKAAKAFCIFILGHSIPHGDKEALISAFRAHCPGFIVALKRYREQLVEGADYQIEPDPEDLLELVAQLASRKENHSRKSPGASASA